MKQMGRSGRLVVIYKAAASQSSPIPSKEAAITKEAADKNKQQQKGKDLKIDQLYKGG